MLVVLTIVVSSDRSINTEAAGGDRKSFSIIAWSAPSFSSAGDRGAALRLGDAVDVLSLSSLLVSDVIVVLVGSCCGLFVLWSSGAGDEDDVFSWCMDEEAKHYRCNATIVEVGITSNSILHLQ